MTAHSSHSPSYARPLFISDAEPLPLPLRLSVYLVLAAGLLLGAALHSSWIKSHPCLIAPGGSISEIIPVSQRPADGADHQMIYCGKDSSVSSVSMPYSEK